MLYPQTQHVKSMSKLSWHVNIDQFPLHFDVLCWYNFDGLMIDVILMHFSDIISMDEKSIQLQRASFNVVLKDKISWS